MPYAAPPPYVSNVQLDAPSSPLMLPQDQVSDAWATELVDQVLNRFEMWRVNNCDARWRLNEWLYYGYVQPRVWEGSSIPRASYPYNVAFPQVESAKARLRQEILDPDNISVSPMGTTSPIAAQQIRGRLEYILENDIDDYGWSAYLEMSETIKDQLIYGNCFGLVEWDHEREQATLLRLDPRDVYVDPACPGPYIEKARGVVIKKSLPLDEIDSMRNFEGFNIPRKEVLVWLSQNRQTLMGDQEKISQEAARGFRYFPSNDDQSPNPSSKFIDVFIYMGRGREIWTLGRGQNRSFCIYNKTFPYNCMRIVSAPCFTVPNRFYAQSFVDIIDPMQNVMTGLLNRHLDEINLALNPPRATTRGAIRPPSQSVWRPGLEQQYNDPKKDMVVFQPQGITQNVFQTMGFLQQQAEIMTGQNSLSSSGMAGSSNANRTKGGMQMQMQAPTDRLAEIAWNYENYFLAPALSKMLKIEKLESSSTERRPISHGRSRHSVLTAASAGY